MSRLMSVAMTEQAVVERRKTVTRRKGWWEDKNGRRLLKAGDHLTLVRKSMGRKPGEPLVRLAEVEVTGVRRESLGWMSDTWINGLVDDFPGQRIRIPDVYSFGYGRREVAAEGFPDMAPDEFLRRFFIEAQGIGLYDVITRISWRYLS